MHKLPGLLTDKDRPKWMRRLHATAKEMFDIENPHPLLHQLAVAEFGVESMSHISSAELQILIEKLKENSNSVLDFSEVISMSSNNSASLFSF